MFFCSAGNSELLTGNVREKGSFYKRLFYENAEILERLFLSEHFQKIVCSGVYNSIIRCRMKSYNFIKRELCYIHFSGYFPKFSVQQFQNTLVRASVMEFRRVLGFRLVLFL